MKEKLEKELFSTKKELEQLKKQVKVLSELIPKNKKTHDQQKTQLQDVKHLLHQNEKRHNELLHKFASKHDVAKLLKTVHKLQTRHVKDEVEKRKTKKLVKDLLLEIYLLKKELFTLERDLLFTKKALQKKHGLTSAEQRFLQLLLEDRRESQKRSQKRETSKKRSSQKHSEPHIEELFAKLLDEELA